MNRCILFAICFLLICPLQSRGDCNMTTYILEPITNNINTWPCGTTVKYFEGSYHLPAGWLTQVGSGAIGWDAATEKLAIGPLSGLVPNPPIGTVEWQGITTFWPGDSDALGDTTPWVGTRDPNSRMAPIRYAVIRVNLADYRSEPDLINNIPADWISEGCQAGKYSFKQTALHEWGHAIGFYDAPDCPGNAMHIPHVTNECVEALGAMDIAAAGAKYKCTVQDRLALAVGDACSCFGGQPDVAIQDFGCVDGIASWYSVFEDGTQAYTIESSEKMAGPWIVVGSDESGLGRHHVAVQPTRKFVRLVETEKSGEQRVQTLDRAWTSTELSAERNKIAARKRPRGGGDRPIAPTSNLTTGCTSWAAVPDYVIFATGPLYDRVDCTIAYYRETQGRHVRIINLSQVAPTNVADFIKSTIHDYYYEFGTKYFHLVGTWTDDFSSSMWQTNEYWRSKREAFLKARAGASSLVEASTVLPTFLLPANQSEPTAASTPYVYSDRPYADVDDDGLPDVVVARWPFTTGEQVQAAYYKLWDFDHYYGPPQKALFLSSDIGATVGDVVVEATTASVARLAQVAPEQLASVYYRSVEDTGDLIADTAARINGFLPDAIFLMGTNSTPQLPAGFFNKTYPNSWHMSLLNPFVYARLIVAASCDAADYQDYSPTYGSPSCVDFLGEPYLGAMEWIGPTTQSRQAANQLVTIRLIEKLNYNPYRPMAESWLLAMRLAYDEVLTSPNSAYLLSTLESYVFLGDPLAPYAPIPTASVSTLVENSEDHVQRSAARVTS